uniref:Uncharacterized protein n=1 Tax=Vespula pensylvanica TaxID=30213 RepID=A0A834NXM3_VESPE|nr:hypothetical protein H0235_010386 [Vespula pensylvanica]
MYAAESSSTEMTMSIPDLYGFGTNRSNMLNVENCWSFSGWSQSGSWNESLRAYVWRIIQIFPHTPCLSRFQEHQIRKHFKVKSSVRTEWVCLINRFSASILVTSIKYRHEDGPMMGETNNKTTKTIARKRRTGCTESTKRLDKSGSNQLLAIVLHSSKVAGGSGQTRREKQ